MNNLFHSRFITRIISGKNNWWKQKKARKLFIEKNVDVSDTLTLWMLCSLNISSSDWSFKTGVNFKGSPLSKWSLNYERLFSVNSGWLFAISDRLLNYLIILSFFTGRHSPSDLCKTNDLHMCNASNCVWVQILFMFCCIRAPLWKTANRFRKQSEKYNRGKTPNSIICFTIIFPSGALRTIIKKNFQHRTELKDSWTWARQG